MSARSGAQTAREFDPGDAVIADRPSPAAEIKHGNTYLVESVEMDDSMGYVRLKGIGERYRPYLLRRKGRP